MKAYWQKNSWNKVVIVLAGLLLIGLLVSIIGGYTGNYYFSWVGVSDYYPDPNLPDQFQRGKTLWDWMGLLIIPIVLAVGALLFNRSERQNEQKIAQDRNEETAVQNYLDKMTELLLEKDLRDSDKDSEVRSIARARTLTILRGLNAERKGSVLQFLHESKLIEAEKAIIDLEGADLEGAKLIGANLIRANLSGANLSGANLFGANLFGANLSGVDLRKANLSGAETNLREANLSGVNLSRANLSGANLFGANLSGANLQETDLSKAMLGRAILIMAHLEGANLTMANLIGARRTGVIDNSATRWPDGFTPYTDPVPTTPPIEEIQPTPATTQQAPLPLTDSREPASPPPAEQAKEAKADEDSA